MAIKTNLGMFKAYDIRTKAEALDQGMRIALARSISSYFALVLKTENVVLCRDARLAAPAMTELLANCLTDLGINVYVNPLPISTCAFYYSLMLRPSFAGIMVTASHNPASYIGFKLMAQSLFPLASNYGPEGGITEIKRRYVEEDWLTPRSVKGKVHFISDAEAYIDYSMRLATLKEGDLAGLNILGEFLSGSAASDIVTAFERAGADFVPVHFMPDGNFPYGDPNPIIESSIAPARAMVREGGYDFGLCFDGDGDRLDIMSSSGEQIVPGFNMAILIPYLEKIFPAKGMKPKFYADVKAIPTAIREMTKSGVDVHIIRNGHSFIKGKLREHFSQGYIAAEEESAHYYMNFPLNLNSYSAGFAAVENTLFFSLLTAKAWRDDKGAYVHALREQKSLFREREWPLHFEEAPDKMEEIMREVEEEMKKRGATIIKTMDDGSDLDATLMRFSLPPIIDKNTKFDENWCQVAERISRSEDAMTRWEVVSGNKESCEEMNNAIKDIADKYVKAGYAHY